MKRSHSPEQPSTSAFNSQSNKSPFKIQCLDSPPTDDEKMMLLSAQPYFLTGNLPRTLGTLISGEHMAIKENPTFIPLGWPSGLDDYPRFVAEHVDLPDILRECFQNKTISPLRNYVSTIPENMQPLGGPLSTSSSHNSINALEVTKRAWNAKYEGDNANIFVQAIHRMNTIRQNQEYDNFVAIIQSSGMGKSRTVDEAAKLIFTIPFNLRHKKDETGYPLADPQIRDFLLAVKTLSMDALELRYLHFLESLLQTSNQIINDIKECDSYEAFATSWHDWLQAADNRNMLYSQALTMMSTCSTVDRPGNLLANTRTHARKALRCFLATIAKKSGDSCEERNGCLSYQSSGLGPALRRIRLMFYFDESQDLLQESTRFVAAASQEKEMPPLQAYQVLCRAFCSFKDDDVFAVYLSTNSKLSEYAPREGRMWSARANKKPDHIQSPWVELPFDTFANVTEGLLELEACSEPHHMVQFGRPLFCTRWQGAGIIDNAQEVRDDIFEFAVMKITGIQDSEHFPSDEQKIKENGDLAAASIRLMFEFEPRRASAEKEAQLVEGHMRIAYSVPKHREYLRAGTPSEPILAEAAARVIDKVPGGLSSLVAKYLANGLISKGERGELIARLLLTLAHDKCVSRSLLENRSRRGDAHYSKPIHLFTYLEALVGPENLDKIKKSKPDNLANGLFFEDAFKDAKINFTHFIKAGDSSLISDQVAWLALSRCMAIQCANGEWMMDLYVPVLLWNEALSRWVVSGMFFQIKNRLKKQPVKIDVTKLGFYTSAQPGDPNADRYNSRPYITIVMNLGVQPGKSKASAFRQTQRKSRTTAKQTKAKTIPIPRPATPSEMTISPSPTKKQPTRGKKTVTVHPRYAFTFVGCSHEVYDVIGPDEKAKFAALLTSRDILDEHPRQADDCIEAVLRLKPYWTVLAQSFHWALGKGEEPQSGIDYTPPREGVHIAKGPTLDNVRDKLGDVGGCGGTDGGDRDTHNGGEDGLAGNNEDGPNDDEDASDDEIMDSGDEDMGEPMRVDNNR